MSYRIHTVIPDYFPDEESTILSFYHNVWGCQQTKIINSLETFICDFRINQ